MGFIVASSWHRPSWSACYPFIALGAIIKFGGIISEARGKQNGMVYSRNTYGNYMRNKVTPSNPKSSHQQNVRSRLSTVSQAWAGLTDAQRSGWIEGAKVFTRTNIFGDKVPLTGFNLYVRLNRNLQEAGVALITSCPAPAAVTGISNLVQLLCTSTPAFTLTFAPTPVPANYDLFVYATVPMGQGVTYADGLFRLLVVLPAATATGASIQAAYTARFGAQAAGTRIFVRAKLVSHVTGLESVPYQFSCVVATP